MGLFLALKQPKGAALGVQGFCPALGPSRAQSGGWQSRGLEEGGRGVSRGSPLPSPGHIWLLRQSMPDSTQSLPGGWLVASAP